MQTTLICVITFIFQLQLLVHLKLSNWCLAIPMILAILCKGKDRKRLVIANLFSVLYFTTEISCRFKDFSLNRQLISVVFGSLIIHRENCCRFFDSSP